MEKVTKEEKPKTFCSGSIDVNESMFRVSSEVSINLKKVLFDGKTSIVPCSCSKHYHLYGCHSGISMQS